MTSTAGLPPPPPILQELSPLSVFRTHLPGTPWAAAYGKPNLGISLVHKVVVS